MRSYLCVLGSCLVCLMGQIHAVILLCPGFLCGLFFGSKSQGPTPVSWVLFWFVFRVNFRRFHCCVLGSCLLCCISKIHAVLFLLLGSCMVCLLNPVHVVPLLRVPGSCLVCLRGSTSCGPTSVSGVLVWFVFWVKFAKSHSCALGSCLFCLMGRLHAVPLLCPGFLSGLSSGSNLRSPTPVSGWSCGSNICCSTPVF